ncbi:MAG: DUF2249 domain-containing protein [Rhodospirillales bacterium]|jgi:uncharacterized protein (DUF2249 family)|nr:DUF2249 domain-containing protein [Rhodospirillales bacterium]
MAVANEAGSEERPVGTGATGSCGGCGCGDREDGPAELIPDWLARADAAAAHRLDVRPMLAAGEGPFAAVMHAAGGVAEGALLLIEAPFDPQPLRRVLAGKGFSTYGERVALGHWQIWCRRGDARADREGEVAADGRALTWRSGGAVHIDVRGLEAPKPLIAILGLIDGGGHAGHIVVHHDRDPLYLYPELEERRWRYTHVPGAEGEVRLELRGPG